MRPMRPGLLVGTMLMFGLPRVDAANCPTIDFGPVPFPAKVVTLANYGASPDVAAFADFNKDKKLDVVYCSTGPVYVLLGDGNGNFTAPVSVVSTVSTCVKVADLDQDGNMDLVLGTASVNVRVALGNGDGTFKPFVNYVAAATGSPAANIVAVADFNGDQALDIAATLTAGNAIAILPGRGDGTFGAARPAAVTTPNGGLLAGDFTGDGFIDLATTSNGSQIAVLVNKGNGTFNAAITTPVNVTGVSLNSIRATDLNGDQILDIVGVSTYNSASKRFLSFLGVGDATFGPAAVKSLTTVAPYNTILTDINGDGRMDALVSANTTMIVMEGLGDGTFADELPFAATSVGTLASADINGDSRPDVVVFAGSNAMRIMLNETEFLPPVPVLGWRVTAGPLRLKWYNSYAGYELEYLPLTANAIWQSVTAGITEIDCEDFYAVPSERSGLYRLVKH
ncbi:MAG TPA: VCBS repeat-containing protein [Verrucomicrobiota bacterium]|nr:VCBS repeat-containing protein [Verrucomicrobiota bacterium]